MLMDVAGVCVAIARGGDSDASVMMSMVYIRSSAIMRFLEYVANEYALL